MKLPRAARLRVVLLLVFVGYAVFVVARSGGRDDVDFHGWFVAAQRMADGGRVYFPQLGPEDEMPNKHGLVFLWMFRPFTWLDVAWAQRLWVLVSMLLLLHALWLLARLLAAEPGGTAARVEPWVALALVAPFVHTLLKYQQTGLFLLWWLVLGTWALARRRDLVGGACLGLAAAIKLLPFALLPWLVYKRRGGAVLGFVLAIGVALAVPAVDQGFARTRQHLVDYVDMLRQDAAKDSQHRFHQSLRPLVLATIAPELYAGPLADQESRAEAAAWNGRRNFLASERLWEHRELVVLLASLGFVLLAAWAIRPGWGARGDPFPGSRTVLGEAGLVLAAMVLISPLAWKHYYVWLLPAAAWLLAERGRLTAKLALGAFALLLTLPHKGLLGNRLAETYQVFHGFAAGLAVVVVLLAVGVRSQKTACRRRNGVVARDGAGAATGAS